MIQLYDLNKTKLNGLKNYKDLKVERELFGDEVLSFSYPNLDSKYDSIKEECYIRTRKNEYVVKEINIQDDWTEFVAKINIEDIKGKVISSFETVEQSCTNAVNLALVGTGWTIGSCDVTKKRTVRKANCSSYDILQEIRKIYLCDFKFDAINKKIYIYSSMGSDKGVYFSDSLNLKKLDIQSNSYDFITRLIPIGKDGLKITDINGGKEYVENYQYSTKVITAYWEDNRYTVVESLKEDAIAKLNELSKPFKSYSADIIDLASLNDKYKNILDYDLGDTITLISKDKKVKEKQRIVKLIEYPDEPEKNTCEIANKTLKFEDIQADNQDVIDVADSVITSDGMIDGNKIDGIDYAKIQNVSIGTAHIQDASIVTAKIGDAQITTAKIAEAAITTANIKDAQITTAKIQDAAITNAKIANASIDSAHIIDAAITNAKIANAAIDNAKIANASIDSAKIKDAAIGTAHIGDGQITSAKIASATITSANIANATIVSANIANASIVTAKIGDAQITDAKIANAAIKNAHIDTAAIRTANIQDASITNAKIDRISANKLEVVSADIKDASITNAKIDRASVDKLQVYSADIQDAAITNAKIDRASVNKLVVITADIQNGAITNAKIGNAEITTTKIADANITNAKIQDASITTAKIVDGQITNAKIANAAIDNAKIGNLAVSTAQIQDAAITNAKIGSLAVKTANIDNASITSAKIGTGQITTALIADAQITNAKIADSSIDNAKIANASINTAKIADGSITNAKIGTAAIGTTQIADGSITDAKIVGLTANKITAGIIDASNITVKNLNADNIVTGTITLASANLFKGTSFEDVSNMSKSSGAILFVGNKTAGPNSAYSYLIFESSSITETYGYLDRIALQGGRDVTISFYYFNDSGVSSDLFLLGSDTLEGTSDNKKNWGYNSTLGVYPITCTGTSGQWNFVQKTFSLDSSIKSAFIRLDNNNNTGTVKKVRFAAIAVQYGKLSTQWQPHTDELLSAKGITNFNIDDSAIDNRVISANTITGDKLVVDAITAREVAAKTITANEIASGTITAAEMTVGTITAASGIIGDAAITNAKIADGSINSAKIENASITGADIANATITNANIASATITAANIGTAAIETAKIKDGAITNAKIANLDASKITAGTISASRIDASSLIIGGSTLGAKSTSWDNAENNAKSYAEILSKVLLIDNSKDHYFSFDKNLCASNGLNPTDNVAITLRPDEGKYGGCIAVEEATTNLLYDNGVINWTISNVTRTDVIANYKWTLASTTGGNVRFYVPLNKLINGETYTLSLKYKILSGSNFSMVDWCDTPIVKTSSSTLSYNFISGTGSKAIYDSTYRFMDFFIDADTIVEIWDVQLERKSFATSFTNGSRVIGKLNYGDCSQFITTTQHSVFMWANSSGGLGATHDWNMCYSTSAPNYLGWKNPSELRVSFTDSNDSQQFLSCLDVTFVDNVWYHVGFTFNNGVISLYVNGDLMATKTITSTIKYKRTTDADVGMWIGGYRGGSTFPANALIDDVFISKRVLTNDEIKALYMAQQPMYDSNPKTIANKPSLVTLTVV